MKIQIQIQFEISDLLIERVVKELMENMPESSVSMGCIRYKYEKMSFTFVNYEDGNKLYILDKSKLVSTFPLMFTDKWPKGCTPLPTEKLNEYETWNDWLCQADGNDFDSFVQLACFGEVLCG